MRLGPFRKGAVVFFRGMVFWLVVVPTPLKNDGVRQLGWWHSQLNGNIKHVPHHQPVLFKDHDQKIQWGFLNVKFYDNVVDWHVNRFGITWDIHLQMDQLEWDIMTVNGYFNGKIIEYWNWETIWKRIYIYIEKSSIHGLDYKWIFQ